MFKKNESYRQWDIFAVNRSLNKNQQKLWNKSREHSFFTEIFCKIDESLFSVLYSNKKSRPNTPVNQLVGALILKHLNNWTYSELFTNLNFNLLTRHALGINTIDAEVFCEASIFNFQNKLLEHLTTTNEDLMEKVFCQLTAEQIEAWDINTSVQRGDSFLVGSNIVDYSQLHLLVETLNRLRRILTDEDKEQLDEELKRYTQYSSSNYVFQVKKEALNRELEQIGRLYVRIHAELDAQVYEHRKAYMTFKRVMEEHFEIGPIDKIEVKSLQELGSGRLMSPDDSEATFRDKHGQGSKGYVTHISETVNPENKVNLITDVTTQRNNMGDAEILENRLPLMIDRTPDLAEYFADGLYGSPSIDQFTEAAGITMYQKTTRGRKSSAEIKVVEDEASRIWVSCKGGQRIQAQSAKKRFKAEFDPKHCGECPYQSECKLRESGGKRKEKTKVTYFYYEKVLVHKRLANIEKLKGKKRHSRSNVEATVKEMKRGMKNGKVRVRQWSRVSLHMILTALSINFTRIHKNSAQIVHFFSVRLCNLRHLSSPNIRSIGRNLVKFQRMKCA